MEKFNINVDREPVQDSRFGTGEEIAKEFNKPRDEWNEEFRQYALEKLKDNITFRDEKENRESGIERVYRRYLKGLSLSESELRGKRITDIGCGDGEFVRYCIENGISSECYGVDTDIKRRKIQKELREHFKREDFGKYISFKNNDLIVAYGSVFAPWGEDMKSNLKEALINAINSIKDDGEIRIYPVQKTKEEDGLSGFDYSYDYMHKVLEELQEEEAIIWEEIPVDIKSAGKIQEDGLPDVWLENLLIIKKPKIKTPKP